MYEYRSQNNLLACWLLPAVAMQVLDTEGVGGLIETAVARGQQANTKLKVGLNGDHGGEPSSVEYLMSVGVDFLSCNPARIPLVRLSGAQAVILAERS